MPIIESRPLDRWAYVDTVVTVTLQEQSKQTLLVTFYTWIVMSGESALTLTNACMLHHYFRRSDKTDFSCYGLFRIQSLAEPTSEVKRS